MEVKQIHFRLTEQDREVIQRIASDNPIFAESPTELLRIALGAYLERRAIGDRLALLERLTTAIGRRLEQTEGD